MTPLLACAACYGQSDSAMAAGMNWGILSLLTVILFVLGGVGGFFIYLAKRSALVSGPEAATASLPFLSDRTFTSSKAAAGPPGDLVARGGAKSARALPARRSTCGRDRAENRRGVNRNRA